ncbi:hypothetical protein Cal7507_1020 [Calothrix sp. PCC 7507]|nr:hypothetical protein Cal7507_1020 [Calothrix sp. PCC 7507]
MGIRRWANHLYPVHSMTFLEYRMSGIVVLYTVIQNFDSSEFQINGHYGLKVSCQGFWDLKVLPSPRHNVN